MADQRDWAARNWMVSSCLLVFHDSNNWTLVVKSLIEFSEEMFDFSKAEIDCPSIVFISFLVPVKSPRAGSMATGTSAVCWLTIFWPMFISFIDTTTNRHVLLQSDTDSRLLFVRSDASAVDCSCHSASSGRRWSDQSFAVCLTANRSTFPQFQSQVSFIRSQKLSLFRVKRHVQPAHCSMNSAAPQKMAPHPAGPSLSSMTALSENHEHQSGPPRVTDLFFQLSKSWKSEWIPFFELMMTTRCNYCSPSFCPFCLIWSKNESYVKSERLSQTEMRVTQIEQREKPALSFAIGVQQRAKMVPRL